MLVHGMLDALACARGKASAVPDSRVTSRGSRLAGHVSAQLRFPARDSGRVSCRRRFVTIGGDPQRANVRRPIRPYRSRAGDVTPRATPGEGHEPVALIILHPWRSVTTMTLSCVRRGGADTTDILARL
ncbi:hypothetical protein AAFF_G00379830 [Aldrovandia affinis]|uniref:Uncharacterized protein n=1 Tax=Aldrovandia affinis TaxID=143900 RepID=A0AAD7R4I9_9TELE|nr:hypothetical protein AAFF_G00379830 [Aldrovandia affinis]